MAPVDIAFVTVNYNTLDCLRQLTDFFASLDAPFTFSYTVVDNNSHDGSQEFLRSQEKVNYLQTGDNLGYGRAINRGVAATASKYICVTNTDVILNRDALIVLWRFLEDRPDAGVCAPRITYEDGRDQGMVVHLSLFSHYALWFSKLLARHSKLKIAKASAALQVDGVFGAFFLVRRSVLPQPTLFDDDFFFYYEDSALAHALKSYGVSCFVVPNATIVHVGGKSSSLASVALFYSSKYLYLKKFYGPLHAQAVFFLDRMRIVRKLLFYWLLSRVIASDRVKSKQAYYSAARKAARLK